MHFQLRFSSSYECHCQVLDQEAQKSFLCSKTLISATTEVSLYPYFLIEDFCKKNIYLVKPVIKTLFYNNKRYEIDPFINYEILYSHHNTKVSVQTILLFWSIITLGLQFTTFVYNFKSLITTGNFFSSG